MLKQIVGQISEWMTEFFSPAPCVEIMRLRYSSRSALKLYEESLAHSKNKIPFYRDGKYWIIVSVTTDDEYAIVRGVEFKGGI